MAGEEWEVALKGLCLFYFCGDEVEKYTWLMSKGSIGRVSDMLCVDRMLTTISRVW